MSPASLGAALAGALCCCCRGCCCRDCCCCCRDCCCCRGCCCWVVGAAAGALGCCCCWPAPWRTLRSLISDPLKMMKSKISSEGSIWADPLHPLKREATQRERTRPLSAWGGREKKTKGGKVLSDPANQPSSFLFFFVAHARARPAGGPGARRGNAMRVRACTYRPSVPKLFTFCNAMLLSTVSIVYRTPSYRISLFEMSEMREPMYGVAIFDQASGRFAALPLSFSPSLAARRSLCLLCLSLRC